MHDRGTERNRVRTPVLCLPMSVEYEIKNINYAFQREKENDKHFRCLITVLVFALFVCEGF